MKHRSVLLVGAPGSGKGTQGKILGAIPGFYHCACGDVFRSLDLSTELGRAFQTCSSRGELVSDELTIQLWREAVERLCRGGQFRPGRDVLVLDGIPRNVPQAKLMESFLDVMAVIHLRCPDHGMLTQRMRARAIKSNRLDDADNDVIEHRLRLYELQTQPLLSYYAWNLIHEVDGTQPQLGVLMQTLAVLQSVRNTSTVVG